LFAKRSDGLREKNLQRVWTKEGENKKTRTTKRKRRMDKETK
jgi:hypothetical protein